ncbi:MAG: 16S rRNA (guanine(527)-N(7))-methyltransferase RsmG [Bacilli bacterium]
MTEQQFIEQLAAKGIVLTERQVEQFRKYYELLVSWNERMNLTAITEKEEVYEKHFFDSITAAFYFSLADVKRVCDVGAGAGFPSIPLKICFPHLEMTIVDSLQKRIGFLQTVADELGLENMRIYHDRAETFGQNPLFREKHDVVVARAVARLSVLAELCLPLVAVGGHFVALKGAQAQNEFQEGHMAVDVLGGRMVDQHTFTLPYEAAERTIMVIEKRRKTPKKYPRKPGTPNKQPITS